VRRAISHAARQARRRPLGPPDREGSLLQASTSPGSPGTTTATWPGCWRAALPRFRPGSSRTSPRSAPSRMRSRRCRSSARSSPRHRRGPV